MRREHGKSIVIEGNDGTGKSTQVELLAEYLQVEKGIATYIAHEPAGTPMADAIRETIKNGELERDATTNLLLFTAARHEINLREKRELTLGHWVLKARDWSSTVAYQGGGEGLDADFIHKVTAMFTDETYMNPDHKIILTLTDETRKARIENRGELEKPDTFEMRDEDFQSRVNQTYIELAEKYGFPTIDASKSIEEVQAEIRALLEL